MTFLGVLARYGRVFGHQPTPEPKTEAPSHTAPRRHLTRKGHDGRTFWDQAWADLSDDERAWRSQ